MPRPEQVPVARATDDTEFGEVAELERLAAAAPMAETAPAPPPAIPGPVEGIEVPEEELVIPEGDDEDLDELELSPDEEFLFGESLRQDEPPTAGAPFGDGPSFIRAPQEDDRTYLLRIGKILAASGDTTAKRFADRIATDVAGLRRLP